MKYYMINIDDLEEEILINLNVITGESDLYIN
jgi:hypothetical protein